MRLDPSLSFHFLSQLRFCLSFLSRVSTFVMLPPVRHQAFIRAVVRAAGVEGEANVSSRLWYRLFFASVVVTSSLVVKVARSLSPALFCFPRFSQLPRVRCLAHAGRINVLCIPVNFFFFCFLFFSAFESSCAHPVLIPWTSRKR